MPLLDFITNEELYACVDLLLTKADHAKTQSKEKFNKNVIDPLSPLIEIAGFNVDHNQWQTSELSRQTQKSVSNSIGLFHQKVLGSIAGWSDLGSGAQIDIVCPDKKIIAEVKNKYNTVKGSDLKGVYNELDDLISRKASSYKGYTSYFVAIIPSKPIRYDIAFTPSDKERGARCPTNESIRQIDGYSFYALATGREHALQELFTVLPEVVELRTKELNLDFLQYSPEDRKHLQNYFNLAYQPGSQAG